MNQYSHTNSLVNETSPYLLQHAHNPVDWHAWGPEALEKARAADKPILLSIGYSACHWCHVMEHESFENEEIAKLMNQHFVNIKVDREERPDLDQIYMNAVQMMTGQGGWPMTVFLTPEGVPFYGGTYFPPEDRYQMPGFRRVLLSVAEAYRTRPAEVAQTAETMQHQLAHLGASTSSNELLTTDLLDSAYTRIARSYDKVNGGFGGAPKFPPAMTLELFLRTYHRTGRAEILEMVQETCRKMANGGIYDQLGGGFHRYSTDAKWLVPHFEKMLYDNALLSRLYLHLYQVTHDPFARRIAEETLDYVLREMTDKGGGFYSTQDADSEGHEGRFFVWSREEIDRALGKADSALFCAYYDVTTAGNFEGLNILHVTRPAEEVAADFNIPIQRFNEVLDQGRKLLFQIREQRVKPDRDEKILTAWNGLMLVSFAEASVILERNDFGEAAVRNAEFVLAKMQNEGLLLRTFKDEVAKLNGYLEDYASLIDGLVTLFEVTGKLHWLEQAVKLADKMIGEFWDDEDGGFFYTGKNHERLIVRLKGYLDNATPSGNSVAADVLLRLGRLTGNEAYARQGITVLRLQSDSLMKYPSAFGRALCALDFYLSSPKEIAIIGDSDSDDTKALLHAIWGRYVPNKVVAAATENDKDAARLVPLLRERPKVQGKATAYVCENYTCLPPVSDSVELSRLLP
ncbi:MAG TPA: thioredoxin domain-containing protein [Pyrinomonadaceae bacterium]